MEQAIKKAMEGGWKGWDEKYRATSFSDDTLNYTIQTYGAKMREDLLFWQALGKAMG